MFCVDWGRRGAAPLLLSLLILGGCASGGSSGSAVPTSPQQQLHDQAVAAVRADDRDGAAALFTQLAQSYPRYATPWLNLALLAHARGDYSACSEYLQQALQRDATLAPAWNLQGVLAREANDIDAAQQAYETALANDGKYAPAWLNLGILLEIWRGERSAALAAYQNYLQYTPETEADPRVRGWIADLQRRMDQGA